VNMKKLQQENLTTAGIRQVRCLPSDREDGEGSRGGEESPRASRGEPEMKKGSILTKWADTKFLMETGTPDEPVFEVEEEPDPYEGQEGTWQWQGDGGEWRDFSAFVQSLIERSRTLKSTKVIFDRPAAYVTIEVFWREGFQRNTLTGQCRDVRLCPTSSSKKPSSSKFTPAPSMPSPVSSPSASPLRDKSPLPDLCLEPPSKPSSTRASPREGSDFLEAVGKARALTRGEKLTMSARLGEAGDKMEAAKGKRAGDLDLLTLSPSKRTTRATAVTPSGRSTRSGEFSARSSASSRNDAFSVLMRSASSDNLKKS